METDEADSIEAVNKETAAEKLKAQLCASANVIPGHVWYATPSGALVFANSRSADYWDYQRTTLFVWESTLEGNGTALKSRSRLSSEFASLRNGMRMNFLFTTYNSLELLATHRNLKPLRKIPSSDLNPPGLDWLNSLSPRNQPRSADTPITSTQNLAPLR